MGRARQAAAIIVAIVLIGLGLLNFVYRDSLMTWQPVPEGVSWRVPFAYLSGALLIVGGAGILVPGWRTRGATVAAIWLALGAVGLHLPAIFEAPSVAPLLGFAEAAACALGLATLTGRLDLGRGPLALRIGFGLCLIVFGVSHFVYAGFTAAMVPAWLPQRLAIAYLTGAVHAVTGLCLLVGFRVRIAALVEAAMMSSFVLLLHIPGVAAAPHDRLQLTMFGMASLLTCAAWLVATWPTPSTSKTSLSAPLF